ncbi:NAD(P)H nitroreductase [Microlunatus panaciterrae]|uniref:Nitroreductase n=1 Tax=Microlunatus panaciterrae TaxID=400768 RepID=A0ABS2RNM8_9ACTN|nr:NAD(P)H nitroreductase [Microlunatus panaciterrae]MBM7800620.1 hypothetical protein [Microlunatus panaciterrae]
MITEESRLGTLQQAIELAGRAPSLHNSQPWLFRLGPRQVELYADHRRWLPSTDTDQRDLLLSCGAALHHLRIALAVAGVHTTVHRLPDPNDPKHLATVELDTSTALDAQRELATAIPDRRSDRRPFSHWPIPEAFQRQLTERASEQGGLLRVITDAWARGVLVAAIHQAATAQDQVPGYRSELESWTGREGDDGIPRANLLRTMPAPVESSRAFGVGDIETTIEERPEDATLMVLGSTSDDPLSQLRAGEAMSAVLLQATQLGLAGCPLSQPLEIGATRKILQDQVLGGTLSPEIVFRFGWAPAGEPLPPTPRRPVSDIIELLPS